MTWLIALFASPERAEAIAGDLEEECRGRARRDGVASARWWRMRQTLATIAHLIAGQLRATPLAIAGFAFLAIVVSNAIGRSLEWAAERLVVHVEVYHWIPASTFWSAILALEIYGTPLAVGAIVGRLARDRAITSIVAMNVVANALIVAVAVARWPIELQSLALWDVLPRIVLRASTGAVLMIAGTALARPTSSRPVSLG